MAIQIGWYVPERVGAMRLIGEFNTEDFVAANARLGEWYDAVDTPLLHTFVDALELTSSPPLASFPELKVHPKNEWTISIIENRAVTFFSLVLFTTLRRKIRFVGSYDEAIVTLTFLDRSLTEKLKSGEVNLLEEFADKQHHQL